MINFFNQKYHARLLFLIISATNISAQNTQSSDASTKQEKTSTKNNNIAYENISAICKHFYSPTGLLSVGLASVILRGKGLLIVGLGGMAYIYSNELLKLAKDYVDDYNKKQVGIIVSVPQEEQKK